MQQHAAFSSAYLSPDQDPRTRAFLPPDYRDPAARLAAVKRGAGRGIAPAVLAALREQDRALGPSAARQRNLDALGTAGTVAVVSGQQTGLFLGPLYTFYKAASAVIDARALERETGQRCVPIFWLQTEDHDYDEIHHCHAPRPGAAPLRLQLPDQPGQARVSVAHRLLGPEVLDLIRALHECLVDQPYTDAFLGRLAAHYRPGQTLPAAFAGLLAELFADEGLLFMDPRQPAIAACSAPIYRQSLLRCEDLSAALLERTRALREAGFDEQVRVRPGSTLVFFHEGAVDGPRYRLERPERGPGAAADGCWALSGAGRSIPESELLALLECEPLRFSSSALLRPLVQDSLLPTVAYIGGPGEINYLAQVSPVYSLLGGALGGKQPLVAPRARFRLLEDNTRALLGKLGLCAADADLPRDQLLRRSSASVAAQEGHASPEQVAARMLGAITPHLQELEAADPSLKEPVRKAHETFERTLCKLAERYCKALLERDRVATERVDRLQGFLHPEGNPQERYYSLPYFACRHGVAELKERVFAALRPFDHTLLDLDL